ncbi:MAG: hypothetical protein K2O17_06050 [Bacteroidaceae bacterium]|nr:hypothetical protein [Bacteroidaceae bacterium]
MKKLILVSIMLLPAFGMRAQDILVTEEGESITAWDVDISGAQKIYYKTAEGDDAPMKSIAKDKVLLWKKADGTKVRVGVETAPQSAVTQTKSAAKISTPAPDASDPEANKLAINKFNSAGDIRATKDMKEKVAKKLIGLLNVAPQSVMADKNVELSFSPYEETFSNTGYGFHIGVTVNVRNKTDKTIYIYLGNTFFLRHSVANPFNTSSASQLAKEGQAAAATGFSQNVIAIPAQSSLNLGDNLFFLKDKKDLFGQGFTTEYYTTNSQLNGVYMNIQKDAAVKKNEERMFTSGQFPIDFGFKVAYSFSEDNTQLYNLDVQLYTKKIIGYDSSFVFYRDMFVGAPLYYVFRQNAIK